MRERQTEKEIEEAEGREGKKWCERETDRERERERGGGKERWKNKGVIERERQTGKERGRKAQGLRERLGGTNRQTDRQKTRDSQ